MYKSLAQSGEEDFCQFNDEFYDEKGQWFRRAMREFSNAVVRNLWFHGEGLLFYVKTAPEGFRLARRGDADYEYVLRLVADGAEHDLRFCEPPGWARDLFINRDNLEAYQSIWNDLDFYGEPKTSQYRRRRVRAVILETRTCSTSGAECPTDDWAPGYDGVGTVAAVRSSMPSYLDPEHPRYAPKLAGAVRAWLAVDAPGHKHPKQALRAWLVEHATEFDLADVSGTLNKEGIDECAKVANWRPSGGAPRTPG